MRRNTDRCLPARPQELLKPHGFEVDEPWYKANVHGKNDREVFSALFPDADAQQLKELSLRKDQCFREQVRSAQRCVCVCKVLAA